MHFFREYRFMGLLLSFVILIVLTPLTEGFYGRVLLDILFSYILLFSVYLISNSYRVFMISVAVAVPAVICFWLSLIIESNWLDFAAMGLAVIFIGYTIYLLTKSVFFSDDVQPDLILGALCVYLLTGLFWAFIYSIFELFLPGSFAGLDNFGKPDLDPLREKFQLFIYYSFVTLTTLGYGDITPINPIVRSLSVLEVISGLFYISTFVAGLVARIIKHPSRRL